MGSDIADGFAVIVSVQKKGGWIRHPPFFVVKILTTGVLVSIYGMTSGLGDFFFCVEKSPLNCAKEVWKFFQPFSPQIYMMVLFSVKAHGITSRSLIENELKL